MTLSRRHLLQLAGALATGGAVAQPAWPDRAVKLVVPFPPGGNSDVLGRILAERLREVLKAPSVIVDNKPGGTTGVGTEAVARAEPDGYTLLLGAATAFTVLPHLRKLAYDPGNGFEFAGGVADYLAVVTVRNDLPAKSIAELVALARQQSGRLTLGSAGIVSAGHLYGEILMRQAGVQILHVPFKGSQDAANALLGGQVDMIIDGLGVTLARSGRARVLASFSPQRHPELPDVPTLAQAGVPFESVAGGWGVMAPKGTPPPIMGKLSAALEQIVSEPATRERLQRASVVAAWTPPAEYRALLESSRVFYGRLLPAIGIKSEG